MAVNVQTRSGDGKVRLRWSIGNVGARIVFPLYARRVRVRVRVVAAPPLSLAGAAHVSSQD
jgi:hypothetical protein